MCGGQRTLPLLPTALTAYFRWPHQRISRSPARSQPSLDADLRGSLLEAHASNPSCVPDKQAKNRYAFVAAVGLTFQSAIRYQGQIKT